MTKLPPEIERRIEEEMLRMIEEFKAIDPDILWDTSAMDLEPGRRMARFGFRLAIEMAAELADEHDEYCGEASDLPPDIRALAEPTGQHDEEDDGA